MEDYQRKLIERERDERLLALANNNSYLLVTGESTLDEILERRGDQSFVNIPDENPDEETILSMIDYFIGTEEYEKCAKLRDILLKDSGEFLDEKLNSTASGPPREYYSRAPRPGRLVVRTPGFHPGNRSSILRRGTMAL